MQVSYAKEIRESSGLATYGKYEQNSSSGGRGDLFSSILQSMNANAMAFGDKASSLVGNISSNSINALKQSVSKNYAHERVPSKKDNVQNEFKKEDVKAHRPSKDSIFNSKEDTESPADKKNTADDAAVMLQTTQDVSVINAIAPAARDIQDTKAEKNKAPSEILTQSSDSVSKTFTIKDLQNTSAVVRESQVQSADDVSVDADGLNPFADLVSDENIAESDADIIDRMVKNATAPEKTESTVRSDNVRVLNDLAKTANVSRISLEDIKATSTHIKASDSAFSDDLTLIEKSMAQTLGLDKLSNRDFDAQSMFVKDRVHTTLGSAAQNNATSQSVLISQALNTLKMSVLKSQSTLSGRFSEISLESANAMASTALKAGAFNMQQGGMGADTDAQSQNMFQSFSQSGLIKTGIESNQLQSGKTVRSSMHLGDNAKATADDLAAKVMSMAARNMKQMTIDLNPENMGRMQIKIAINDSNEAGVVSIAASNAMTREVLEGSMGRLRDILMQNGILTDTAVHELADNADGGSGFGRDQGSDAEDSKDNGQDFIFASSDEAEAEEAADDGVSLNLNDGRLHLFA